MTISVERFVSRTNGDPLLPSVVRKPRPALTVQFVTHSTLVDRELAQVPVVCSTPWRCQSFSEPPLSSSVPEISKFPNFEIDKL